MSKVEKDRPRIPQGRQRQPTPPAIEIARNNGRPKSITLAEWKIRLESARPMHVSGILYDYKHMLCPEYSGTEELSKFAGPLIKLANRCCYAHHRYHEAIAIWETILITYPSDNEAAWVVSAANKQANRLTHTSMPKEKRDFDTAIKIWQMLIRQQKQINRADPNNAKHLIDAIMSKINRFTPIEGRSGEWDLDSAIKIWSGLLKLSREIEEVKFGNTDHLVRSMMWLAKKLSDPDKPKNQRDTDSALRIWTTLIEHAEEISRVLPKKVERVIKTMMNSAHDLSDLEKPRSKRDPIATAKIWAKLVEESERLDPFSPHHSALVVRTMFKIASKNRDILNACLSIYNNAPRDEWINVYITNSLYYYLNEYDLCLSGVDAFPEKTPILLSLKAEALRKKNRRQESHDTCEQVLQLTQGKDDYWSKWSRLSANCCIGYLMHKRHKLNRARRAFMDSLQDSKEIRIPPPSRVLIGLAYVEQSDKKLDQAEKYAKMVLDNDRDNKKAKKLLVELEVLKQQQHEST